MFTFSPPERAVGLAWRESFQDWAPCTAFPELSSSPGNEVLASSSAPPAPSRSEEEITAVRVSSTQRTWGREHDRWNAEISAEILLGAQRFHTTTENLSEGGLKFKQRLPEWVAGYFTVILSRPEGSFEITCMLVEDQKEDKTRVAVVDTDDEESHLPLYRKWVRLHFSGKSN